MNYTSNVWKWIAGIILGTLLLILMKHPSTQTSNTETMPLTISASHSSKQPPKQIKYNTQLYTVKHGDTLNSIFHHFHIPFSILQEMLIADKSAGNLRQILPGKQLQIQFDINKHFHKLILPIQSNHILSIELANEKIKQSIQTQPFTETNAFINGIISSTLNGALEKAGLNPKLMTQYDDIFSNLINLRRDIHKGEKFRVLYQAYYLNGKYNHCGKIIAAELINNNKTYDAFAFTQKNITHYFTKLGKSIQPSFDRYPLHFKYKIGRAHV